MDLDIFTDKQSGLQFCARRGASKTVDYNLIQWCIQFLNKDEQFIDIGSYMGTYTCILSHYCKHVHTFEASPLNLKSINLACKINNITNIDIHPIALSDEVNQCSFYTGDGINDCLMNNDLNYPIVQVERLDDFDLQDICFMKLDVVGHELKVLQGALNTLKNNHYPPFIFNNQNEFLIQYIKNLGYNVHRVNGTTMGLASDHEHYKKKEMNRKNKLSEINLQKYLELKDFSNINVLKSIAKEAIHYQDYANGIKACELLSIHDSDALIQMYQYIKPIPYKFKMMLNCTMKPNRVPNNPSIIRLENGDYLCNIRCSNYVYEPHFRFLESNIHLSEHMLITLSPKFMIKKTIELVDKTNNIYYDSFVKGIDDLRLIDENRFICSHGNFNNHRTIQQCLGTFDEYGNITKLIPLKGPDPYRHEKNWLPLIKNDELYIVYMIHPFTLYKVDDNGELTLIKKLNLVNFDMKGSASFIPYKDGLLATVHQTTKDLSYIQRFIWMDKELTTIKYSVPFYFQSKGIEFSLGMCHSDEGLIITHSIKDNDSCLIVVDYDDVDSYLGI